MRYLLVISSLLGASALAATGPAPQPTGQPICAHTSKTARVALSVLFTAEKAYYAENGKFGQNLHEMGADDRELSCDSKYWSLKAYVRKGGEAFTGTCTSLLTGETWVINEMKKLKQVKKPSSK